MSEYTKFVNVMQYTETVYLKDGEEITRERNYDDYSYDAYDEEPMTTSEIDDYGDPEDD